MKKILLSVFVLIAGLLLVACEDTETVEPGTLTIDDIEVYYQETEVIIPVFSNENAASQPVYTFEGNSIRIDGNVITGLVANTETEVTAKTDQHETTFNVKVLFKIPFGDHAITGESDDIFTLLEEDVFVKESNEYGETFFYDGDDPLHGIRYMLRGTLQIDNVLEDGQAQILVKEFADKEVRFVFEADAENPGTYRMFSDYRNGEEFEGFTVMKNGLSNVINFNVLVYDGLAYMFISDTYVGNVTAADIGEAHIGFGGQNAKITVSRLRADHNEGRMATYLAMAVSPFGNHAFSNAPADPDVFTELDDGVYVKSLMTYQQTFYYEEGLPVAGEAWTFEGHVEMTNAQDWAQFVLMITDDNKNMTRYVFEKIMGGGFQIFFDRLDDGVFKNWTVIHTQATGVFDFVVFFENGNSHLALGDEVIHSWEGDYEKTHIGLGGEKATITLSNVFGETNANRLEDYIPLRYQLGEHFGNAVNDPDVFEKTSLTSFEKVSTEYGQSFLTYNGETLEGTKYTFKGIVSLSNQEIGATAIILFQQDENNFTRFVLEYVAEGLKIFTDNKVNGNFEGWKEIYAPQAALSLNIVAVYDEGTAYLLVDENLLVKVETEFTTTQLGFAGEKGTVTISELEFIENSDYIAGISGYSFGNHLYGGQSNNSAFLLESDGSFKKTSVAYAQSFLYQTLSPVAGSNFSVSGTIVHDGTANASQSQIILMKDDSNMRRIAVELFAGNIQTFSDVKKANNFSGWTNLNHTARELNFTLNYVDGQLTFFIGGRQALSVNDGFGDVHFGFAATSGMTIKNLVVATTDEGSVVEFVTNGGSAIVPLVLETPGTITPPITTRQGFELVGWFKDEAFETPWDFENDVVKDNITLYAQWVYEDNVILGSIQDGGAREDTPNDPQNAVFVIARKDDGKDRIAYFEFKLDPTMLGDKEIVSAKIRLNLVLSSGAVAHTIGVHTVTDAWNETTLNWTNKPSYGAEAFHTIVVDPADGNNKYVEIEVADLIDLETGRISIALTVVDGVPGSGTFSNFASKEHSQAVRHPQFILVLE